MAIFAVLAGKGWGGDSRDVKKAGSSLFFSCFPANIFIHCNQFRLNLGKIKFGICTVLGLFRPMTVQMQYLALIETKWITVYVLGESSTDNDDILCYQKL